MTPEGPAKGTRVRIPKGTPLQSTHPQRRGPYAAGRAYTVTVEHTLSEHRVLVGRVMADGRYGLEGHWRQLSRLCDRYGIKHQLPYDDENYSKLGQLPNAVVEDSQCPGLKDVWLVLAPPKVRWAGSGGYWTEAAVDDVEVLS